MQACAGTAQAQTLPTGGAVASGKADIGTPQAGTLTINQASQRAVINWNAFSVGQGGTVSYQQPNAASATLNRVAGDTASTIAGRIQSNGQVFLVNPNGILITRTGTVDTAGFTASTLDTSNADFMAGRQRYIGNGQSAGVVNQGRIRVHGGGDAVLIGGHVTNEGVISAPGGRVGLASGERVSVDMEGDGFLTVAVPTSDSDRTRALISQTGHIRARGGRVEMRAATSADVARAAIQLGGTVEAGGVARTTSGVRFGSVESSSPPGTHRPATPPTSAASRPIVRPARQPTVGGTVVVDGGAGGRVTATGRVNVASQTLSGGSITMTGRAIDLSGARLDASGATGGGQIRIGGDYQGGGSLQRAETISIDAATTIRADATTTGNGGRVIVWSDQRTQFAATISARGGAEGGDGGFAEVSGKAHLAFTGIADLRATGGQFGTLLLDPYNVTISNDPNANQSSFTATGDDSVINVATLQNQLALANVTISTGSGGSQAGDITVAAPIVWASGSTLTLNAYRSIAVNANVFITGAGGLALNTNQGGSGGTLSFALGSGINFTGLDNTGQSLSINNQSYTLIYNVNDLQAINSNLNGRYALARPIDGGPTASWNGGLGLVALGMDNNSNIQNGGNGFNGTFEGLGNVIYNLNVRQIPTNYVGLFGYVGASGVISNVGLRNVNISGQNNTGALAGYNRGTITRSWADGRVDGTHTTGGLVGYNLGTITQSYSNAGVTANNGNMIGGLVGRNDGTIRQVYATGAVLGGTNVGGLIGFMLNTGTIDQAFASGAIGFTSGATSVGGIVGYSFSTNITDAFFVTDTTGRGAAVGAGSSGSGTAISLAQFLNGGPQTGFAGGTGGLMPHLVNFYPNGAEMISGTAYRDLGLTPLVSGVPQPYYTKNHAYVSTVINGIEYGRVTTGANGVYMTLLPRGTLASGAQVLAFTNLDASADTSGATNAATLAVATGAGQITGLDIYGSTVTAQTSATLLSQVGTIDMSGAAGQSPTALAALAGATGRGYLAMGASFTIDLAQNLGGQQLFVRTQNGAPLTVAAPILLQNNSRLALNSGGALAINANITMNGAGTLSMSYGTGSDYSFGPGASMSFYDAGGNAFSPGPGWGTGYDQLTNQYLTINGSKYYIVYSKFQLDEIDGQYAHSGAGTTAYGTGLGGNFALAYDLDMAGTNYSRTLVGRDSGTAFSGTFAGLGHWLSNFTMSIGANNVGLFGYVDGGTIRDIGITGGNVSGSNNVGGLVGYMQNGTVLNAYSNANVTGNGNIGGLVGYAAASSMAFSRAQGAVTGGANSSAGGLVGFFSGTLSDSYATGAVTQNGGLNVGGLVGWFVSGNIARSFATGTVSTSGTSAGGLAGLSEGAITQSFALGGVRGSSEVGGLVGLNRGTVAESFAAGVVIGSSDTGGLIGLNFSSVTNSYYNSETAGAGGVGTGLTTNMLQYGGLAALGFDTTGVWAGAGGGLYPYLTSSFRNGVNYVSGTVYQGDGTTPFASGANGFVTVSLASGGAVRGNAAAGANGYYYILMPAGSLSGSMVAYTAANAATGALNSAGVRTVAGVGETSFDLQNGWRTIDVGSSTTTLSAANASYATAAAGSTAAGMTFDSQRIKAISSNSFVIDTTVSLSGTLALMTDGTVTQTAAISAGGLLLRGGGAFTLTNAANQVGTLAADVASLSFVNAGDLTIGRIASSGTATSGIVTGGSLSVVSGRDITIATDATVLGTSPVLSAARAFINLRGSDAVSATSGRWLVYSSAPTGNIFGGLDSGNTAIFNQTLVSLAPGSVSQSGNRYIFAHQPTLTFTSIDSTKAYGDDGATALQSRYTVTGYDAGISGAYLGDTAATAFTGAAVLTSSGTGAMAVVGGGHVISIAQGTLTASSGYAFSFVSSGNLAVTQRAITVTADGLSRIYGNSNPALTYQISSGSLVSGDSLTGSLATTATAMSGVGPYAITQGTLDNTNYAITYVGANLDVTQRAITVTADGLSRVYGNGNPMLTYQITSGSLINNDSFSGALATAATGSSGVNTYAITQGTLDNTNYAITYVGANLAVTQRAITVMADAQSRTYGDANPSLTYQITSGNLFNNDNLSGALATAAATSGVGTYAITQGTLGNANYAITYTGANLAVTPRAITVMADAQSRLYGDATALSYTIGGGGLVNGDGLSGALATAATATSGIGTYAITRGTLGNANYAIAYTGANLTVSARPITITADNHTRAYGEANPALTFSVGGAGLANGDVFSDVLVTTATSLSGVGSYAITQGAFANANYTITGFSGANLIVTARPVTITAVDVSRSFGQADPALTYLIGGMGLANGDQIMGSLMREAGDAVGSYAILRGSLALSSNYQLDFIPGRFTISPTQSSPAISPMSSPIAISQLATFYAPPPALSGSGGTAVLDGLVEANVGAGLSCRSQPAGGMTCP
jgi:filamentous hemagglutinin family protein